MTSPVPTPSAVTAPTLPLQRLHGGKVRELYAFHDDVLLVASDRLSAFDIVFEAGIPEKGRVLTGLSAFWFDHCATAFPHHCVTTDTDRICGAMPELASHREVLAGRAMWSRRAEPLPVECVVRGYLDGSAWQEYSTAGTIASLPLPTGLVRGDRLPMPLFTPATKAQTGHDENISYLALEALLGETLAARLRDRSLALYAEGAAHAETVGLILADTKFEFGWGAWLEAGARELLLIDELFTPDSSRFWDAADWQPGGPQPSFDKQPVRDFLTAERAAGRWDGEAPLPPLPAAAIEETRARYREAYRRLTGRPLPDAP
ncbi:MAG: phosphoribosylaminoimidazolesuccinocarboxamide synthase [Gemmatimonadota bacterium]